MACVEQFVQDVSHLLQLIESYHKLGFQFGTNSANILYEVEPIELENLNNSQIRDCFLNIWRKLYQALTPLTGENKFCIEFFYHKNHRFTLKRFRYDVRTRRMRRMGIDEDL